MNKLKLYISSGVFILLTAVRLISPNTSELIADAITSTLNLEDRQTKAVISFGSSLTKDDVISVFEELRDRVEGLV